MDPFEEFEFKPLTEGLGFHTRTPASPAPKAKIDFNLEMMAPDMVTNTTTPSTSTAQIQAPLPRRENSRENNRQRPMQKPADSTAAVDEILKTLGERRKYEFAESEPTKTPLLATTKTEISAALLDAMLIFAGYLAAMIVLLMVTKIDLFGNLLNPDEEGMLYVGLAGLFLSFCWIYLVAHRVFLGYTPGEWVFDQRLGLPEQMGTANYSMKVAVRSAAVIATGLITMPLISVALGRDVLGRAMGLELMKKV